MNLKKTIFPLFIVVALAQLFVPLQMILGSEDTLENGTEYKFKTEPVDPTDPFRGKYIRLRFEADEFETDAFWEKGERVYVAIAENEFGFAEIISVTSNAPGAGVDYFSSTIKYVQEGKITVEIPFNRFYMEESKAPDAELVYREVQGDTLSTTYGLVNIKDGEAILSDVLINDTSIASYVSVHRQVK